MTKTVNKEYPTATLYYDGKCSLCTKEIKLLNKLKSHQLELVDLWQANIEIPRNELIKLLHLQTSEGQWKIGIDANVAAWQFTPIGFLWKPLRWPLIRVGVDRVYQKWAKKRLCKLNYSL